MVGPAFFNQRDEQGAGFFDHAQSARLASRGISVAAHCGVCRDDKHVTGIRGSAGGFRSGLDYAEDRDRYGILNGIESKCAGGVAGDDHELSALFAHEKLSALDGVAGNGTARFGPVGKAGGVAQESESSARKTMEERAQHGEPAEAGIEDADGGLCVGGAVGGHRTSPADEVSSAVK